MNAELEKHVLAFLDNAKRFAGHLADLEDHKRARRGVAVYESKRKAHLYLTRAQKSLERVFASYRSIDMNDLPQRSLKRMEDGLIKMEEKFERVTSNLT
jgi:hypothetical protein